MADNRVSEYCEVSRHEISAQVERSKQRIWHKSRQKLSSPEVMMRDRGRERAQHEPAPTRLPQDSNTRSNHCRELERRGQEPEPAPDAVARRRDVMAAMPEPANTVVSPHAARDKGAHSWQAAGRAERLAGVNVEMGGPLSLVPAHSPMGRQNVPEACTQSSLRGTLDELAKQLEEEDVYHLMQELTAADDKPPLTNGQLVGGFKRMDAKNNGRVTVADVEDWYARLKDDSDIDVDETEDVQAVFERYAMYGENGMQAGHLDNEGSKLMIQRMVRICGLRPLAKKQLDEAALQIDRNGDGRVTFQEFADWWSSVEWRPSAVALQHGSGTDCERQLRFLFHTYCNDSVETGEAQSRCEERGVLDEAKGLRLMKYVLMAAQLVPMTHAELTSQFKAMCPCDVQECDCSQFTTWWANLEKRHQPTTEGILRADLQQLKTVYHKFVTEPEKTLGRKELNRQLSLERKYVTENQTLTMNGAIEAVQYMTELTKLVPWTEEERIRATEIDYVLDGDGNGEVDEAEFIAWWQWVIRSSQLLPKKKATIAGVMNSERDAILQIFNVFDVDRGGDLDEYEAAEIIRYLRDLIGAEPFVDDQLAEEIERMQKQLTPSPHDRNGEPPATWATDKCLRPKRVDFTQFHSWWKGRKQQHGWSTSTSSNTLVHVSRRQVKAWFTTVMGRVGRTDDPSWVMSKMQTFELLSQVMHLSGLDPLDDVETEAVYVEMDADQSGQVDFDEFFAWWRDNRRKLESKSICKGNRTLLWAIFRDFDATATASVTRSDFDQLILTLTRKADIEELNASALEPFKSCGDQMDFEDFCNWWDRQDKVENHRIVQTKNDKADLVRNRIDEIVGGTLITGTVDALGDGTEQVTEKLIDVFTVILKALWWCVRLDQRLCQLWTFLNAEVSTDRKFTNEQWTKIFVLQVLSYCLPPLMFWRCIRKTYFMPTAAQVDEFVKRSLWTGSIIALQCLHSRGVIKNVSQTEVSFPMVMYAFFVTLAAAEEASLTGTDERRISWKKRFMYSTYVRCFPTKSTNDRQDGSTEQGLDLQGSSSGTRLSAHRDHLHASVYARDQVPQRLRELGSTLVHGAVYDSLHFGELEHVHVTLLNEQPGYFSEVVLRIHQAQRAHFGRSSLEDYVLAIADPPSTDPDCHTKRQQYEDLLVSLKREELDQHKFDGKVLGTNDHEIDKFLEQYDEKVADLRVFRSARLDRAADVSENERFKIQDGYAQLALEMSSLSVVQEDETECSDTGSDTDEFCSPGCCQRSCRCCCCCCCCCCIRKSVAAQHSQKVMDDRLAEKHDELTMIWQKMVHRLDRDMKRPRNRSRNGYFPPDFSPTQLRSSPSASSPSRAGGRRRSGRSPLQSTSRRESIASNASFVSRSSSVISDSELLEAASDDSPSGTPARVIAETIERLGTARAEDAFRVGRYACILCAVLHALAPLFHYLVWGCMEETRLYCDESCEEAALLCADGYEIVDVVSQQGKPCFIVVTLSCEATRLDVWMHGLSAFTSFGIFYSICIRMLRGFCEYLRRYQFLKHFSELTPWPTMRGEERTPHYGLLPTFDLDTPSNIMAWNRIRLYLLSFDSQVFVRRQLSLSAILLASFLLLVFQLVQFAAAEQLIYNNLIIREPISTDLTMIMFDQISLLLGLGSIMFIGVRNTAMQTHTLRYIVLMKKAQLYNRKCQGVNPLYFSSNYLVEIDIVKTTTLKQIQRFLEERFGIQVQNKQLSIERKHFYVVENVGIAKRCTDEIKSALATKPIDTSKLRTFSMDLRDYTSSATRSPIIAEHKRWTLEQLERLLHKKEAEAVDATASQDDELLSVLATEVELYRQSARLDRGIDLEREPERAPLDLLFRHYGTQTWSADEAETSRYMKVIVRVSDGRDLNIGRQALSHSDVSWLSRKENSGMAFDRLNGVVAMRRRQSGGNDVRVDGMDAEASSTNYTDCTEMLRGLAEILEEERLLSPTIVNTLEDVRCRLHIMPRVAVPLTKAFASSVVSVLAGGVAASVQIVRMTQSWQDGDGEWDQR